MYNRLSRLIYLMFIEPLLSAAKRRMLSLVAELGKTQVLEVGCGTCVQGALIANKGISVTAVDVSEKLFPSLLSTQPPTLRFFQADALDLPFQDGEFDVALISMVLHEMAPADRIPVLHEMQRAVKDGGILFIMDFDFEPDNDRNWTALLIRGIEKMAGEEHHGNFRNFMAAGGVPALLRTIGFLKWKCHPIFHGRGGIFEVQIEKQRMP